MRILKWKCSENSAPKIEVRREGERERERERDLTQQKRSRSDPICDLAKPKVLEKGYKSNVKKSDTDFAFYK